MEEIWKDVPGFEGKYQASTLGNIRMIGHKPLTLNTYKNSPYYKVILIDNNNKRRYFKVHKLVWITFNGPISKGLVIDHIDGCRTNNVLSNLRAVTIKENCNNPATKGNYFKRYHKPGETQRRREAQNERFNGFTSNSKSEIGWKLKHYRMEKKFANICVDFSEK